MTERDILAISEHLCERGFLRCTGVAGGMPTYEVTLAGRLALMRPENGDN